MGAAISRNTGSVARAARSGDAAALSGYIGHDSTIDHILAEFASRYADLNDEDHAAHGAEH